MGIDKNTIKKSHDEHYNKKADELKFNESIDDSYTNKVINKYKQGHKKNKWFIASGATSIAFGLACILIMAIVGIVFLSSKTELQSMALYEGYDYEGRKKLVENVCIVLPIVAVLSILVGLRILKYSNYTREMLMNKTAPIMFMGICQMFVSGFVFCILTFAGYFVGRGIDYGAIYYNRVDGYNGKKEPKSYVEKELEVIENNIFIEKDSQN